MNETPRARIAMDFILELYKVEHEATALGIARTQAHFKLRMEKSKPILDKFFLWLEEEKGLHTPKGGMGKAIAYAINNKKELYHFLKSEQIPLDNNISERALRIVALTRKNSLFVGNDDAGQNLAMVLSLGVTCQTNGINPFEYLRDVLLRVQIHPSGQIDDLLPVQWQEHRRAGRFAPIE
jgi:transposase